jgi:hypothetical protein
MVVLAWLQQKPDVGKLKEESMEKYVKDYQ